MLFLALNKQIDNKIIVKEKNLNNFDNNNGVASVYKNIILEQKLLNESANIVLKDKIIEKQFLKIKFLIKTQKNTLKHWDKGFNFNKSIIV